MSETKKVLFFDSKPYDQDYFERGAYKKVEFTTP